MVISGTKVSYQVHYTGFRAPPDASHEFELSPDALTDLIEYLQREDLLRGVTETRSTDHAGHSVDLHITIRLGAENVESHLAGMVLDLTPDSLERGNLDYRASYAAWDRLVRRLKAKYVDSR